MLERLDRSVANSLWLDLFQNRVVEVLSTSQSDHQSLLLMLIEEGQSKKGRKKPFRFEGKWLLEEEGGLVVEEEWKRNLVAHNSLQDVHLRLKRCSGYLIRWNARKGRTKDKE